MLLESKDLAKKNGDIRNMVAADMNLGNFYLEDGRFLEAIPLLEEGLVLSKSQQDERTYALIQSLQCELYYRLNRPEMAILKADSAFKTLMKYRLIKEAMEPAKHLYELHKKSNPLLALEMLEKYLELKDTLEKESNQRAVIQRQYKIKYEKQFAADSIKSAEYKRIQDAEVKQKEAEVKQKETELIAKRKEQYLLFGGLALIIIFSIFIFNRFRITRKQKNVIAIQKELVEEKNKEIMDSINYARRLQEAILPPHKLVKEYLPDSFILYKPKDIVAGDFYWMESVGDTIYFAAADCTGHGVPGALVSVVCSNALTKTLLEDKITTPGKILDRTRELVIEQFARSEQEVKDGMDISLVALAPIGADGQLSLQWAGANNPLWIIRNGEVLETKADKQPIGKYTDSKPFTNQTIELQKGDTIYIFTDGYQDQFGGEKGKKYKAANLKMFLISIVHEPAAKQRELLIQEFERWKGNTEQIDDVCVIGVKL
jgi:serine phosphatase RsbU (regulator of sigma subunit)